MDRASDSYSYFVSAAHCTDDTFEIGDVPAGGPNAHQPTTSDGIIGDEVADPPTFTNSADTACPASATCRYSDAALFQYRSGESPLLGEVARPSQWGGFAYTSTYYVVDTFDPFEGSNSAFVGITSGATGGEVTNACVKWTGEQNGVTLLCQFVMDAGAQAGDSGSPVFRCTVSYPCYSQYRIASGVLVGNSASFGGGVVSGIEEVLSELEADFGSTLTAEIWGRSPPSAHITDGPTYLPDGLLCTWTGSGSGGVGGYTYAWSGVASGSGRKLDAIVNSSGYLYLTVKDEIGHQGQTSVYITIDPNAPAPEECQE